MINKRGRWTTFEKEKMAGKGKNMTSGKREGKSNARKKSKNVTTHNYKRHQDPENRAKDRIAAGGGSSRPVEAKKEGAVTKFALPKRGSSASSKNQTRINKFLAHGGIASRRESEKYISAGLITINGEVVTDLSYKVKEGDEVRFNGTVIEGEKKQYVLLNKPKDFITTLEDDQGRKTVMDLVNNACDERIYPVGRLDRATTGVLLFTNDGDLVKKLTHPSHGARKIYHVVLDRAFTQADFEKLEMGLVLEDGEIKPDKLSYIDDAGKNEVGIELHSGKNRIVRRTFESLGYTVTKLDRVIFADLTKKNLKRGQWRHLEEKEIGMLKMKKKQK
mgnify:CR=1 FL=1